MGKMHYKIDYTNFRSLSHWIESAFKRLSSHKKYSKAKKLLNIKKFDT